MEILTLLKANIKKKKSTFISVAILMIIVTSAMSAILSSIDNYYIGFDRANETAKTAETSISIRSDRLSDELKEKVENSSLVKEVVYYKAMAVYGTECGDIRDGNSSFLEKMHSGILLFNSDLKTFSEEIPPLKTGEIYVPLGLMNKMSCNVGDTLTYETIDGFRDFKIAGFVQEPSMGSSSIGWKQVFISDEDFDSLYEKWKPLEGNSFFDFTIMLVYKANDCNFSSGKFQRELNLETKIADYALGALTKDQTMRFSTLLPDIITKLFMVFVAFLFVIILILISHSISTEIESDYVTFGILKSQGFSNGKLAKLFFAQYIPAELLGIVLGLFLSIPIEAAITDGCQLVTGVMPNRGLSVVKSLAFIAAIIAVSSILIFIKTRALGKISPVKAINGGKEDIYFDSRIKLPISKRFLSASLGIRQFTSAKRKYIGMIFISAILVFFMLTVNLIIELITSSNALNAMGAEFSEIVVYFNKETVEKYSDEVKELVTSVAEVKQIYVSDSLYLTMNGENIFAHIVDDPEMIFPILKGRAPIYDNEAVITEMVADTLEIGVGDEVTISCNEKDAKYVISGIFQTAYDSGMCFAMSESALRRINDVFKIKNIGFSLEDPAQAEEVKRVIKEKYDIEEKYDGSNAVWVEQYDVSSYVGLGVEDVIDLMRKAIYVFSAIFALVTVRMVCTKAFLQERTDIGIYKAIGFTSKKLRISFGLRFLTISFIGSAIGVIISLLFSAKVLGLGLSMIGLSHLPTQFNAVTVTVPVAMLLVCFFVFAYLASGKIKKVAVRELVVE